MKNLKKKQASKLLFYFDTMIEFLAESHTYLNDGIIRPSVSQILRSTLFPKMYQDVPKEIIENASRFGTNVHKAIETGCSEGLRFTEGLAYKEWLKLKEEQVITPIHQELLMAYKYDYCGTIDMIGTIRSEAVIIDIKTTAKLNTEYLSWQLAFYKYAYEYTVKEKLEKAYCVWLPKRKIGQLIEIEIKSKEEVIDLVSYFKRSFN